MPSLLLILDQTGLAQQVERVKLAWHAELTELA